MPKSRFNAVRERARATRHNPVGRKNDSKAEGSEEITTSTILTHKQEDVLPILKSLPLDDSSQSKAIEPTDVLWALTSLTGFLSNKASRTLLLAPQHNLISRILLQLNSSNHVQLRDAASGCLRNLCIESGGKVRKILESRGCAEQCIKEVALTAKELGFIDGPARAQDSSNPFTKKPIVTLTNKPKEEMNRKEKRQAAKAEAATAAMAKRKGSGKTDSTMEDVKITEESNTSETNGSSGNDEHILLCCSHLNNLISILWCLAEVSSHSVDLCHKSASILSKIFSVAIGFGIKSISSLSKSSVSNGNGSDANSTSRIDVGKKDQIAKDKMMIQIALTALNALVTLTDSDQEFSSAFVGVSKYELQSALKGKKKSFLMDDTDAEYESKQDGIENLGALANAVDALEALLLSNEENEDVASLRRQATSLSLLSMATLRNIQSCLPGKIRESLLVPMQTDESADVTMVSVGTFEVQASLACLTNVLTRASNKGIESLVEGLKSEKKGEDGRDELSKRERQAEEEFNNINLALEILAEMAGDREGWNVQASKRKAEDDSIAVDDEEEAGVEEEVEDDEMEFDDGEQDNDAQSDLSLDPQDEEMFLDDAGKMVNGLDFTQARISSFFHPDLVNALLTLGVVNQTGFTQTKEDESEYNKSLVVLASSLRSISIRSLSVLNNQFLVLASFAKPPPSQPTTQQETIDSFQSWLKKMPLRGQMAKIWRWQFEFASRIAALPCLANANDQSSLARDARKVVEIAICIMWSLSRCFEEMGIEGGATLIIEANQFVEDDFCKTAQSSLGIVDSLIAAYKSSKRAQDTMMPPPNELTGPGPVNSAVQLSPTADGIRIHSLGVLSTLVRQPIVPLASKANIISLLADILEVLPKSAGLVSRLNALQINDSSSVDAVVVAINGIIDTFADETSAWDSLYSQLRLQSRLKRTSVDVKTLTRTVDKRKHPALRSAIDEAWSNLVSFLQYRDGLVASV